VAWIPSLAPQLRFEPHSQSLHVPDTIGVLGDNKRKRRSSVPCSRRAATILVPESSPIRPASMLQALIEPYIDVVTSLQESPTGSQAKKW